MPDPTPNQGYNRPDVGEQDWHEPVNENFTLIDEDIAGLQFPIADRGADRLGPDTHTFISFPIPTPDGWTVEILMWAVYIGNLGQPDSGVRLRLLNEASDIVDETDAGGSGYGLVEGPSYTATAGSGRSAEEVRLTLVNVGNTDYNASSGGSFSNPPIYWAAWGRVIPNA